ncbi:MAG: hypothetical protein KIH69_009735, partial [Anaerolineae bacterium]|nr:hypothetical protein [Anaerolineae bacterium]
SKDLVVISDFNDECNIKLWNLNTKNEKLILRGHKSIIKTLNLDVVNSLLISASNDKTIKIWDYVTGTLLKNYSSRYEIKCLDVDRSQLVYASGNGDLVILDLQTLNEIKSIHLRIQVHNICINNNMVVFSHGNEIKIYDLEECDYIANAHIDHKINSLKAIWAEDIQIFVGDIKGNLYKFVFSLQNSKDIL